ncbi:hypothetical protein PPYR_00477, partial [Photinus pyralis]
DSGYPCLPWLFVPIPNPNTNQQHNYNNNFKRCRSTVERCIGVLKGRFRCLLKDRTLHYEPRVAAQITLTCCVLHNIAIHYNVQNLDVMWDEMDVQERPPMPPLPERRDVVLRQMGQEARRLYIEQFF